MEKNKDRFIEAATILLGKHYVAEDAHAKACAIEEVWSGEEGNLLDLIVVTATMAGYDEPWWDNKDPKVRAIAQLQQEILCGRGPEQFIEDVELSLGRSLGKTTEAQINEITWQREQILAELKGEPIPEPTADPVAELMRKIMPPGADTSNIMDLVDPEDSELN